MSKQSSRGSAWERVRMFVLNRDDWTCAYCQKHLEGSDATADHIIPKDAGGTNDPANLVAACLRCNGLKSNKILIRTTWFNPRWFPNGAAA